MSSCEAVTEPCGYLNYDGAIYFLNPHNRHHSLNSLCLILGNPLRRNQTKRNFVHKFGWHPPWKVVDGYKKIERRPVSSGRGSWRYSPPWNTSILHGDAGTQPGSGG